MTKMNVLSLFSGIGAFESALRNMEIPFNLVGFSEIDKYAVKSYCAIHNVSESLNLGDITKIDETKLPNVDLVTYGFPCQDISLAGKQKGLFNDDGTRTRSGLFFDALRIIEATRPMVAIAENVKNLIGKKFKGQFDIVLSSLENVGYNNYWKVLNAKDYGIPQNRERVFIVSIRKDVDPGNFEFPEGYPLKLRLKDLLEETVDEKYYLSEMIQNRFKITDPTFVKNVIGTTIGDECTRIGERDCVYNTGAIMGALNSTDYKQPKQIAVKVMQIGNCRPTKTRENPNQGRVYDTEGLAPCLHTMGGGNLEPHIVEPTIQRVDIPQTVKVRKYPVDTKKLVEVLKEAKRNVGETAYGIAEVLDVSQTKVAHWFRTDECFAIPDAEIWMDLKKLLKIETGEFDESIMTFEEKEGVFEKSERHYHVDGIAPTLTSTTAAEKIIVPETTNKGIDEPLVYDEQNRYIRKDGCVGTIMTDGSSPKKNSRIIEPINPGKNQNEVEYPMNLPNGTYRIRKLTPKECFRLMGFKDEEFAKAEAVNSNTQLYKQAGNSIVVDVAEELLNAIFQYFIKEKT